MRGPRPRHDHDHHHHDDEDDDDDDEEPFMRLALFALGVELFALETGPPAVVEQAHDTTALHTDLGPDLGFVSPWSHTATDPKAHLRRPP